MTLLNTTYRRKCVVDIASTTLGWPRFVQDDLSFWMAGRDRPLRLLLQLDGDFGPGKSVYFMMSDIDLAARRFGHYEFAVQVT